MFIATADGYCIAKAFYLYCVGWECLYGGNYAEQDISCSDLWRIAI